MTKIIALTEVGTVDTNFQMVVADGTTGQFKKTFNNALVNILNNETIQVLSQEQTVDVTNRSTNSTSFVASLVQVIVDPVKSGSKISVQVAGIASVSVAAITFFTLFRKINAGSFVDITPSGSSEMIGIVTNGNSFTSTVNIDFLDTHGAATGDSVTYALYWKTQSGTSHLGRRALDTLIDTPTIITATEYIS